MKKEELVGTEEFMIKLWDKFDERMEKEGYELWVNTDEPNIPRGTKCFKEDKYVAIIDLNVWEDTRLSIFISNRNGNAILDGNTVEINSLKFKSEDKAEDVEKRFDDMLDNVLSTYKQYNKQNRLEFGVDDDEIKRINW